VGSSTRLWRTNRRIGLNHPMTRAHDLQGPFTYGRYGTETASPVVTGDTESVRHTNFSFTTFVYQYRYVTTLSSILSCQGKNRPLRTDLHGTIRGTSRSIVAGQVKVLAIMTLLTTYF
jgi:hypothetical protein